MAFTRINGRCADGQSTSHIVASCVCLCFSFQSLSQDDDGGYLQQCSLPQTARHGQALCHLSRHISQRYHRPDSACIVVPHRGSSQSECGFPLSMWCSVPFCLTPHHKTSRPPPARSCSWVSSSMSTSPSASSRVSTRVPSTMSTSPCASSCISEEPDATVLCTEAEEAR